MAYLIAGVDPGISGAIAFYDIDKKMLDSVFEVPTETIAVSGRRRNIIDLPALASIINEKKDRLLLCTIEHVHTLPKDGKVSAFSFGMATGQLQMAFAAHGIPLFKVAPEVWKPSLGLSRDKNLSLERARAQFPELQRKFLKKGAHGSAEAAILAKYGLKFLSIIKEDLFK